MRKMISLFGGLACLLLFFASGPVQAQFYAYVSPTGIDAANDCLTAGSPCRQIYHAMSQIPDAGVVIVAPGEYATFNIGLDNDKAVDVIAPDGQAVINGSSVAVPGGGNAAIVVQGRPGKGPIRIVGFTLNTGTTGIAIVGNNPRVLIEDCYISSVNGYGIDFRPSAGSPMLYVNNTHLDRGLGSTGGGGVKVRGTVGSRVTLEDVRVENNITGIMIDGTATTGINKVVIRNSTSVASDTYGLYVIDSGGGSSSVKIEDSEFSNNTNQGIVVSGANAVVRIANSSISNNVRGLLPAASGKIISQGGNVVAGNTVDGAFTSSLPFK